MMGLGNNHMYSGSFWGIGILLILFVLALIAYKQNIFSRFFKRDERSQNAKSILAEKYSSGELSKEEYERKINVLND